MKDKFGYKASGKDVVYDGMGARDNEEGRGRFDLTSAFALMRLARVYEKGGKQRGDRNWEKGFPFSRAINSSLRHIIQYIMGMTDEDHLAHAAWNLFCIIHFEELGRKDLDDMPHYNNFSGLVTEISHKKHMEVMLNFRKKMKK